MSAHVLRRGLLVCVGVLLPAASASAGDFHPFDGPRPIAIYVELDPWADVLGADDPRVAVYEDGQVIYVTSEGRHLSYRTFTLDAAGLAKVNEAMAPVLALEDLKPHYDIAPDTTDQPEAMLYVRSGEREVTTSIYGLAAGQTVPAAAGASA